jgi:predicted transposase YbfD/YdcC
LRCQDATSAVPLVVMPLAMTALSWMVTGACWTASRRRPNRGAGAGSGIAPRWCWFAVAAVLAGADSMTAMTERAADAPSDVLAALDARCDRRGRRVPPSPSAFRRLLRLLDAEAVAAGFGTWLRGQVMAGLADAGALIIALDGNTVRGARTKDGTGPHLLAAMICGVRAVIAQRDADAKTTEITQVKPLLAEVDITGALVMADAAHVQKETACYLVEDKGASYLFTAAKDNQPSLFAALDALDRAHVPVTRTARDRGHGRDETRTPAASSGAGRPVPHAAQAFWIERAVRDPHDGRLRPAAAAALGITSRTLQRGGTPEIIAAAARGHRDIEALHHVRDTTMNEAAQRLRAGSSAQVIAAVRNTAVAALRLAGFTSTAPGRRWATRNPARPVAVLNLAWQQ